MQADSNITEQDRQTRRSCGFAVISSTSPPWNRTRSWEPVNYAAVEYELERLRKRLDIWQIFMKHMKRGRGYLAPVHNSLTQSDLEQIVRDL